MYSKINDTVFIQKSPVPKVEFHMEVASWFSTRKNATLLTNWSRSWLQHCKHTCSDAGSPPW